MPNISEFITTDMFREYFELYGAERKTAKQEYTPDSIGKIISQITRTNGAGNSTYAGADCTAGTGGLLIQKWNDDRMNETPWSYAPHNYLYYAAEYGDNVIPYLIHNLLFRGMNCIVVHGDTLTMKTKQVYFIQNDTDDYMKYSSLNVMPHTENCKEFFNVNEWVEDGIEHVESEEIIIDMNVLPSKKKAFISDYSKKPKKYTPPQHWLTVGDVAHVERAVKKRIYPKGAIVVQMSATSGQCGLLKSSGEVDTKYAVVIPHIDIPYYLWSMMKKNIPQHFYRVKQGLNVVLDDIKSIPYLVPCFEFEPYQSNLLDYGLKLNEIM